MTSYVEKYLSKGGKLTPVKSTLFEFEVEKDPERLPFRGVCVCVCVLRGRGVGPLRASHTWKNGP